MEKQFSSIYSNRIQQLMSYPLWYRYVTFTNTPLDSEMLAPDFVSSSSDTWTPSHCSEWGSDGTSPLYIAGHMTVTWQTEHLPTHLAALAWVLSPVWQTPSHWPHPSGHTLLHWYQAVSIANKNAWKFSIHVAMRGSSLLVKIVRFVILWDLRQWLRSCSHGNHDTLWIALRRWEMK